MFYIYHIPDKKKIGCTDNIERRSKRHKSNLLILETHFDINIASIRERELQKQYGYNMDKIPYSLTYSYASKAGKIGGKLNKGKKNENKANNGEKNPKAKLTNEDVLIIRELIQKNNLLQKDIAKMFNVDRQAIRKISQNKTWKHI